MTKRFFVTAWDKDGRHPVKLQGPLSPDRIVDLDTPLHTPRQLRKHAAYLESIVSALHWSADRAEDNLDLLEALEKLFAYAEPRGDKEGEAWGFAHTIYDEMRKEENDAGN